MNLRDSIKAELGKASKAKVHYGKGMKSAHCGICKYFQPPSSCSEVAGDIEPDRWCELFKRRPR